MGLFQSTTKWITINDMKTYDAIIKTNGNENELKLYQTILDFIPCLIKNTDRFGETATCDNNYGVTYSMWITNTSVKLFDEHTHLCKLDASEY